MACRHGIAPGAIALRVDSDGIARNGFSLEPAIDTPAEVRLVHDAPVPDDLPSVLALNKGRGDGLLLVIIDVDAIYPDGDVKRNMFRAVGAELRSPTGLARVWHIHATFG